MKVCTKCKEEKPLSEYYIRKDRGNKPQSQCKTCRKPHKDYIKGWHLKTKYGITVEQWERMLKEQEGCCAICGIHQSLTKNTFHVDHDHHIGRVRGLLCNQCNRGIGYLQDNADIIDAASEYLRRY